MLRRVFVTCTKAGWAGSRSEGPIGPPVKAVGGQNMQDS